MTNGRDLLGVVIVAIGFFGSGVFAGMQIEQGDSPLPATLPVVGDKPERTLIRQDGRSSCNLVDRSGYKKDDGCPVTIGRGFQAGFHTVRDGWKITQGTGENSFVLTLTVVNENPGAVEGFSHNFHLERYDDTLVELVTCNSKPFTAGQSQTVICKTDDNWGETGPEPVDQARITL